jgi:predicted RNA binding protein YcfA (HicA-like mRNA interferase family)
MPPFGPLKHGDLVRALRKLGFEGPFAGGKHLFMVKGQTKLVLPNPHRRDIGKPLLAELLRQAGIAREDWERT